MLGQSKGMNQERLPRLSGRMSRLLLESGELEWGALWEEEEFSFKCIVLSVWCFHR